MSIADINRALAALDRGDVTKALSGGTEYVCDASVSEWNTFAESEGDVVFRANQLEWVDGRIYIVELASPENTCFSDELRALIRSTPGAGSYPKSYSAANVSVRGTTRMADVSFAPRRSAMEPFGCQRPRGVLWRNFRSLVIEVGLARKWGHAPCSLDWKATQVWVMHLGVRYVLCVAVDRKPETCWYKLYEVVAHGLPISPGSPTNVSVDSNTVVQLDARRLLAIPGDNAIPPGFPDPFEINLSTVLRETRDTEFMDESEGGGEKRDTGEDGDADTDEKADED